ncbi:hypothetical protein [Thiolinea disciformis]|uniref:hypothetical protein n=1 Tax=Thiolinea disciformis TaxID=125614 RepID=UPI00035D0946|nr:hypothetical protein [Thiolinea disciformis]
MKARIFLTIVLLLLAGSGALAADESVISQIRQEYNTIRKKLPLLNKTKTDLSGYSAEGGNATAYKDSNKNIQLIKVELYGESGKLHKEFYYKNRSLIFTFSQNHRYNVPFYITPELAKDAGGIAFDPQKTKITEDRYYFDKGKMIRWIDENKKEVTITSKAFKESEQNTLKFSNELLAIFK